MFILPNMKIKLLLFFSLVTFLVMTINIVEYHSSVLVQHEITVESVGEVENAESESIGDIVDFVEKPTRLESCCKSLSFPDKDFVFFTLTKNIFKPPRII